MNVINRPKLHDGVSCRGASFFVRGLCLRVGLSDEWARFAQAETQWAKPPLALPRSQLDREFLLQVAGEGFALPNAATFHAGFGGTLGNADLTA